MSRNRMKNSQSLHWMGVAKWLIIFGMLAGLGYCYMLCKNQRMQLADKVGEMNLALRALEQRNDTLEADLQGMKSMKSLEHRLAIMHSTLIPWGDPRAAWMPWQQNTRAAVARIGTIPRTSLGIDSVPVASTGTAVTLRPSTR